MKNNITTDPVYEAVDPKDFRAMMDVDRYGSRSDSFDKIISATHDHFWDPLDKKYIDFSLPFDLENEYLTDPEMYPELQSPIGEKLNEKDKIRLVNLDVYWSLSTILHGEQGALNLSSSLCHIFIDPGAQEYVANQTREEARHVSAFSLYIKNRWGRPMQVGDTLGTLLDDLVQTPIVWKKIVGMQMLVEGLAMGAFSSFYKFSNDPLLVKLMQLVMTDEAFHHKFGKIWADKTIPKLNKEERDSIEDWAWEVFHVLLFNLVSPDQKKHIYAEVGIDWQWAQSIMMEAATDENLREEMLEATNIFRVLVKTLLKAGIITERTAGNYAAFVDIQELYKEGDWMVGDDIAEEGIKQLIRINGGSNKFLGLDSLVAAE